MVWVSAFSDEVFSLKNTYTYLWWQQSERSSLGSSYRGESIQFDLLYLHKRCFLRIDNGLKDSKVSSITDTKFYFHLLIFTAKTDVLHVAAERHFGEQKFWDVPSHSWPSKHTGQKNHIQPPLGRVGHRTTKGKTGDCSAACPWPLVLGFLHS